MSEDKATALYELLGYIRPIQLNSARVVSKLATGVQMTVGSRAVLAILVDEGPLPVPAIAARLDLPRQAVQRHVNDLVEHGHVRSRPNPAHRRSDNIEATAAGRRAFAKLRSREQQDIAQLAADCTTQDIATAVRVLRALDRDIRERALWPNAFTSEGVGK